MKSLALNTLGSITTQRSLFKTSILLTDQLPSGLVRFLLDPVGYANRLGVEGSRCRAAATQEERH